MNVLVLRGIHNDTDESRARVVAVSERAKTNDDGDERLIFIRDLHERTTAAATR